MKSRPRPRIHARSVSGKLKPVTASTVRSACLAILAVGLCFTPVEAGLVAQVDQSRQRMRVYVDGTLQYEWPVSTARAGYVTPNGRYRVGRMERIWHSRKYHGSPMPHALFFNGGYAIHGTGAVSRLGRRASHGCVRLSPGHARTLFQMARARGGAQVSIYP